MFGRKAKGIITPKVGNIITLYNQGKISQIETAENPSTIVKLQEIRDFSIYWNTMSEMFIPTSVWD